MQPMASSQCYFFLVHAHRVEHLGGGEQTYNPVVSVEFNGHKLQLLPAKETHTLMFEEKSVDFPEFQELLKLPWALFQTLCGFVGSGIQRRSPFCLAACRRRSGRSLSIR
ncbi:unnamed protein product [Polarella glacialis]|uniref:Uncharacterized protein n=1 Tax=Polarella glacialis TaxID=89957 RepID=A0A813IA61_POLGL|nr:unnamed protein product [Polarella glacialis]CAE8646790.1 unnamed protein product [Polarella glacialis]